MATPAWLSALGVASSIAIAIVAIWGERIRAALFRPDLSLELVNNVGQRDTANGTLARYYRLRLTNRALHPAAHEVQVFLTQMDIRGPDGQPQTIFTGALPLPWQYQPLYPNTRTIGYNTIADVELLFVSPEFLQLTTTFDPPNFAARMSGGDQHFWITTIARGLNGESPSFRLKTDWDGLWEYGDNEMGHHLNSAGSGPRHNRKENRTPRPSACSSPSDLRPSLARSSLFMSARIPRAPDLAGLAA
ncbi:MAG: hypothetical protein WA184_25370 [Stellaceae bacterium]